MIGPDGKPALVNYRVRGTTYIVDRLFAAAELDSARRRSASCASCAPMPSGGRRSRDHARSPSRSRCQGEAGDTQLRARPQPVTRINRKVLIGGAAVLLLIISGIVLVALKPPSLRITSPQELFNVDHKPITDGLSKLPATYDGMRSEKRADAGKAPAVLAPGVPS